MMGNVVDGYITGRTSSYQRTCERCGEMTDCVEILGVVMPPGVTVTSTILQVRGEEPGLTIRFIGIGCGDYAKFHRQLVHITG